MSFAQKVSMRSELLWLVKAIDDGEACWYYLLLEKPKLELFKARIKTDTAKLTDYGKILYSGWGEVPPADIQQKIKEQFG